MPWPSLYTSGEDIPILTANTGDLSDISTRSANFGTGFRVGIGATVPEINSGTSPSLEVGIDDNTDPTVANKPAALVTDSIAVRKPTRIYEYVANMPGSLDTATSHTLVHNLGYIPIVNINYSPISSISQELASEIQRLQRSVHPFIS